VKEQSSAERLILFSRYPEPGKTKTRLIPVLGPRGAAQLQRHMTEHALSRVGGLIRTRSLDIEVRYDGGSRELIERWLGEAVSCRAQGGGDLGRRLEHAFSDAFAQGVNRVVIMGTDCPGITAARVDSAFDLLGRFDVVLGPATDGGYYLIGLRHPAPQLFVDMPWGTAEVKAETLARADASGLEVVCLESLGDVDRPEDLWVWHRESGTLAETSDPDISVIIPTLNEAGCIRAVLGSVRCCRNVEVLVVDGGSSDGTVELARAGGARMLTTAAGRARQMNAGAAAARGRVLLFVHGDTRLPEGFDRHVLRALERPHTVAGAFRLRIGGTRLGLRCIEVLANLRSRLLQLPYGDQGVFLEAELFHAVGGFPDMPIMEDFALVERLKTRGRIAIAPVACITSARRWSALGIWKTTLVNQVIILGYKLGVDPSVLARWYRRHARSRN
jgi:hypothetical protein